MWAPKRCGVGGKVCRMLSFLISEGVKLSTCAPASRSLGFSSAGNQTTQSARASSPAHCRDSAALSLLTRFPPENKLLSLLKNVAFSLVVPDDLNCKCLKRNRCHALKQRETIYGKERRFKSPSTPECSIVAPCRSLVCVILFIYLLSWQIFSYSAKNSNLRFTSVRVVKHHESEDKFSSVHINSTFTFTQ